MTITHVQSGAGAQSASATSVAATISAVGSGNLLAGWVYYHSTATTDLSSVSDDKGNTYTIVDKVVETAFSNHCLASFYAANITNAPTVITANFGTSLADIGIFVDEYSGVATSAPLDGHAMQSQTSPGTATDAVTSGSITTVSNGDLIYGCGIDIPGTSAGISAGTGFTIRTNGNGGTNSFVNTEDKIQTSAGSVAATSSLVNNVTTFAGVMAFAPPGSGGGSGDTLMGAACL